MTIEEIFPIISDSASKDKSSIDVIASALVLLSKSMTFEEFMEYLKIKATNNIEKQ